MRVYVGGDHAGFEFKKAIIEHLRNAGHEPIDCGAFDYDAEDDYPAFCIAAAERTVADPGSLGIVLGGSGNGEQIAANKVIGVRAALCNDLWLAEMARSHNDANVLSMGGRVVSNEQAEAIVEKFLATPFEGGRHERRVALLAEIEKEERA